MCVWVCVNVWTWFWTPVTVTIPRVWGWLRSPILLVCQVRALRFAAGGDCFNMLNWLSELADIGRHPLKFICSKSSAQILSLAQTSPSKSFNILKFQSTKCPNLQRHQSLLKGSWESLSFLPKVPCVCSGVSVFADVCAALRHHTYRHPLRWPQGQPRSAFFLRYFEMLSSSFSKYMASRQSCHSLQDSVVVEPPEESTGSYRRRFALDSVARAGKTLLGNIYGNIVLHVSCWHACFGQVWHFAAGVWQVQRGCVQSLWHVPHRF